MRLVCLCLYGERETLAFFDPDEGQVQVNSRIVGSRQIIKEVTPVTNTESLILAQDEHWRRA